MSGPKKIGLADGTGERRRLRPGPTVVLALVAAAIVLAAGLAFTLQRDRGWESRATVTLEPAPLVNGNRVGLLDVFDRSGTLGTYVERISSDDTLVAAGSPPIEIEARSIPDTRVIEVFASSPDRGVAEEGLADVVAVVADDPVPSTGDQRREMDLWTVEPTEQPSEEAAQGPSDTILIAASLALAALAGLLVFVLGRRTLLSPRSSSEARSLEGVPPPPPEPALGARRRTPVQAGQAGPGP